MADVLKSLVITSGVPFVGGKLNDPHGWELRAKQIYRAICAAVIGHINGSTIGMVNNSRQKPGEEPPAVIIQNNYSKGHKASPSSCPDPGREYLAEALRWPVADALL